MKKQRYIAIVGVSILIFTLFPIFAFGWGYTGHRIVGEIAFYYLKPGVKKTILKILHEPLATACTWADFVRSDSNYAHDGSFHYINVPNDMPYDDFKQYVLDAVTQNNVVQKIDAFTMRLTNNSEDKEALYYLIHLVGDLHQPLHVGAKENLGGNTIKLIWFGQPTNLHALWDSAIIAFQELSYTEYAQYLLMTHATSTFDYKTDVDWAWESYNIAKTIYAYGDIQNDYLYNFKFKKIIEDRLWLAGRRLAVLLNNLYSK